MQLYGIYAYSSLVNASVKPFYYSIDNNQIIEKNYHEMFKNILHELTNK